MVNSVPGIMGLKAWIAVALVAAAAQAQREPAAPPFTSNPNDPVPTDTHGKEFTVLPSGLRYIDLAVGNGASPTEESAVTFHHVGWLEDGRVFDTSLREGEPETLGYSGLIPGWKEGLATMREGGKRQMIVPPHLAYGADGRDAVPPNATLMFEMELIKVVPFPKLTPLEGISEQRAVLEIKFWDIKVGTGPSPTGNDRIQMNYAMFTKDGKVLDTSVKRGKPVTVPLDQLFAGWRELMYTMKVGGKRRMEIPPPLAAGRDGVQGWIPPSTTLVVEVELVGVNPTAAP